jgi:hypothetical protein
LSDRKAQIAADLAKLKPTRDVAGDLAAVKAIPGEEASARTVSGGGKKPLRMDIFLRDKVIPSARAVAAAPGIGAAEMAATVTGAPGSFIAGAANLAGYPNVAEAIRPMTIEGQREFLGVPTMRAVQDIESAPFPARVVARGVEYATGGIFPNNALARTIASNPNAVTKIGAIIDAASGAAGESAATIARYLGADPATQEAGRAWTGLVTAMGGPAAVNFVRGSVLGVKDALVPKPQSRLEEGVGAELAANRLNDPGVFDTARQNAQQFTDRGMKPPPLGSLTGNPTLIAEQRAALTDVPGLAQYEQTRQADTDAFIREDISNAAPQGDVAEVGFGLQHSAAQHAARAQAEMAALDARLAAAAQERLRGKQALGSLIEAAGDSLAGTVATLRDAAETRAATALERLGPGLSARQAGDVLVDELDKARTEFRQTANSAYEQWLGETDGIAIRTDAIKSAAETAAAPSNPLTASAETVPRVVQAIRDAEIPTITPRQLQALRSQLLNDLRLAQGGANANPKDARRISEVLDAVDQEFERIGTSVPGWRVLNEWYREGKTALHGGRFRDVGRELTSKGGAAVDPSVIAGRFLNADTAAGADEAVEAFNRAYGGQLGIEPGPGLPEGIPARLPSAIAGKALDEHIVEQLRLAVTDLVTGRVDGDKLARWVRSHNVALARRPELARRLNSVADVQVLLGEEAARMTALQKEYEGLLKQAKNDPADAVLASRVKERERELNNFRRSTESAEKSWKRAFDIAVENPQGRLDQIAGSDPTTAAHQYGLLEKELAGNEAALAGLRKGMWEALTARVVDPETGAAAAEPLTNPKAFAKLMQTHGNLIRKLFGPQRRELLRVMQRLAKQNTAVGIPTPSLQDIGGPGRVGQMLSHLLSRSWSVARGVVGPGYVASEALMRAVFGNKAGGVNQAQARRLLTAALYDADTYEDLLKAGSRLKSRTATRRLAARMSYGRQGATMLLDNRDLRTKQDVLARKKRLGLQ